MTFLELQKIFHRAFWLSFSKKKLLFVFFVLTLCGLVSVFFRGLAVEAGDWLALSFLFIPVFLCSAILLSTGVVLIRIYHDEVKKKAVSISQVCNKSWDQMISSAYLTLPLLLAYLLLWVVLGIFYLLKDIPTLGHFIGIIFAFAPFILIFGTLLLAIFNLALLFFVTPAVALSSSNKGKMAQIIVQRMKQNILGNFVLAAIAISPALVVTFFLVIAAMMTDANYLTSVGALNIVLQWFFIMLPFALILSPAVVFFFNFAAEAHVLMRKDYLRQE